ncbi:MAG: tryptophan--tRNA ligase [Euryarchaeota archaeon]|nr:tryptophan--tRNA ligase [Euryarchaeota archaeon]MDE1835524.1 tryptophan--tRNA ligase [Euryarchaeota archaeon]MDE1879615.1 tryptophan--tRNA ligase [Euryarchaeota archaeon]MDE2043854.1 tryptophan--tRNA ligase [Thermoplasmata archaeon]
MNDPPAPHDASAHPSFKVTPWEVKGKIDYERLREQFGTSPLDGPILARLEKMLGSPLHPLLAREVYISHRDLPQALDSYERGNPFFLYTGRGPSGEIHLAHLIPFEICAYLQRKLGVNLWIQVTDDEKFLFSGAGGRTELSLAETYRLGRENLLDLLSVGFDPKRTHILFDTISIHSLYPLALEVAKRVTFSTAKAVFGFKNDNNIGSIFFTAIQSVPAFLPSARAKRPIPCLIPCGVDQDPHFRITRDVAEALGYPKPALLHNRMLPGLLGDEKMSSSADRRDNAIFLSDSPKDVQRKISHAFTGGRSTVEEQRRLGANPDICSVHALWKTRFAPEPKEFEEITRTCRSGELLCGECKGRLVPRVEAFLAQQREQRAEVEKWIDSAIERDAPTGSTPS